MNQFLKKCIFEAFNRYLDSMIEKARFLKNKRLTMKFAAQVGFAIISVLLFTQCLKNEESPTERDRNIILDYLESNQIDNAVEDETGLFYIIDQPGANGSPTIQDFVNITYDGYLLDGYRFGGTEADTSTSFFLGGSIAGWQIGIPKLQRGGSGRFWVPSYLGLGSQGLSNIPPNSVLYFEITLNDFGNQYEITQEDLDSISIVKDLESNNIDNAIEDPSGIYYVIEEEGTGEHPTLSNKVEVKYAGYLLDGTKFDGTKDGETVKFNLSGLIEGWKIAIQKLKPGGKGRFWIPSTLAYGPQQAGQIPPNSVLVFDIELISIE